MTLDFDPEIHLSKKTSESDRYRRILDGLQKNLQHDQRVESILSDLRATLEINRVVIYYFYREWEGQVTFESLSEQKYSIAGTTGPDQCFNEEYAQLYLEGRVRAIDDINTEPIAPCHRDFLRYLDVRANVVVPIVPAQGAEKRLWGLLIGHHCESARAWTKAEVQRMQEDATALTNAAAIQSNLN